jgi:hypothetical protein
LFRNAVGVYDHGVRRFLLATIVAVVVAAPVSAAWGGSSAGSAPAAKTEVTKTGSSAGKSAPNGSYGAHGDGQCPFAETPAI